jgi:predicted phage terminase large subunit-like protein
MTGRGANLIIIDDPIKPLDAVSDVRRKRVNDWFDTTVIQRLNDKARDAIIVVMQRVHENDLAGHLLEKEGFVHLCLSAIAPADEKILVQHGQYHHRGEGEVLHPERESFEDLMRIKADIGSHAFVTQYLQEGISTEGTLVKWEWFRWYERLPERSSKVQVVQSWDFANTANPNSDWSVCTTWYIVNGEFYLADVYRVRLDFPDLCQAVAQHRQKWNPDSVLIEDAGAGTQMLQHCKHMHMRLKGVRPVGDKVMRLSAQSAKVEAGSVFLPRQAGWLETFKLEMLAFPRGRHDDQVDSFSQLLGWYSNRATTPGIGRF